MLVVDTTIFIIQLSEIRFRLLHIINKSHKLCYVNLKINFKDFYLKV